MLVHVVSASQASTCGQQLCFSQVVHAESPAAAGQEPPPPLLLPLPLPLLVTSHGVAQLLSPHVMRAAYAESLCSHCAQFPSVSQVCAHVTQVESLSHAVAWAQHWAAMHIAQVVVAVTAGHEPPPLLDPLPELVQLPDDDPPPIPPPIPPPPDEPQLLLPPLEEEHPKTARAATTADAPTRPIIRFIGEAPVLAKRPNRTAYHAARPPTMASFPHFRCGPAGVV